MRELGSIQQGDGLSKNIDANASQSYPLMFSSGFE